MQVLDGQRLVCIPPGTHRLTGVVTYPPAGSGKGMFLFKELQGFMVFFLLHQGNKPLDGYMGRTGGFTGCNGPFGDSIGTGYGLFILFKNRFSRGQAFIMLGGCVHRADLGTFPAGGTFFKINKSWFFFYLGREIPLFSVQF